VRNGQTGGKRPTGKGGHNIRKQSQVKRNKKKKENEKKMPVGKKRKDKKK